MRLLLIHNLEPQDVAFNKPLYDRLSQLATLDSRYYFEPLSLAYINKAYDGIVISGAPLHYDANVLQTRLPYFSWIKEVKRPVLGICLGHQNIGLLHGADMITEDEREDGEIQLIIKQSDKLLEDIGTVTARHSCSVSRPVDFIVLASTKNCVNQAMKHARKSLYGVQFHPELSESGSKVLQNFVDCISLQPRPQLR